MKLDIHDREIQQYFNKLFKALDKYTQLKRMNEMNENLIKNEKNFIWTRKIDNKTFFLKNQTSLL